MKRGANILCPIMSYHREYVAQVDCKEDQCAWWDGAYDKGRCCIFTIAKNLDYVADICDGTRNLFVREV